MSSQLETQIVSQESTLTSITLDDWQDFVVEHPQSTTFHHRAWLELLSEQYNLPIRTIGVVNHDQVVAGLPFIETKSVFGKRQLSSLPFTDSLRALAADESRLQTFATTLCRPSPLLDDYHAVRLKTDQPLVGDGHYLDIVRHELDTTGGLETVRSRIAASARRNIKRANAQGLDFQLSRSLGSVSDFYALHLETRRRLGVPIQPKRFFQRLHEKIIAPGLGQVALVLKERTPIAGGIILQFNRTLIYKYVASKTATRELRPNDFFLSQLIDMAVQGGYHRLDLGTSRECEHGLRRFKSKWGAVESRVVADCIRGRTGGGRGSDALLSVIGPIIQRSPAFVCRCLGELLYRFVA